MYEDYEVPNGCSELTDQERAEHEFIELFLNDNEIESVALACNRVEDVILAQLYFARAKRDKDSESLGLLAEIIVDRLKIKGVKLGVPDFVYFS